jgi:hypothetical protein
VGAGRDPRCALKASVELESDDPIEIVFVLGKAAQVSAAQALNTRCRAAYGFGNYLLDSMVLVLARRANAP